MRRQGNLGHDAEGQEDDQPLDDAEGEIIDEPPADSPRDADDVVGEEGYGSHFRILQQKR